MPRKIKGLPSAVNISDENTKRTLDAIINTLRQMKIDIEKITHNKRKQ